MSTIHFKVVLTYKQRKNAKYRLVNSFQGRGYICNSSVLKWRKKKKSNPSLLLLIYKKKKKVRLCVHFNIEGEIKGDFHCLVEELILHNERASRPRYLSSLESLSPAVRACVHWICTYLTSPAPGLPLQRDSWLSVSGDCFSFPTPELWCSLRQRANLPSCIATTTV